MLQFLFMNCVNICGCLWLRGEGWVEVRRGRSSDLIPVIPAWFNSDTPESSLRLKCIAFYCLNSYFFPLYSSTCQASVSGCASHRQEHLFGWTTKCHLFLEICFWSNFSWGLIFWSFPRCLRSRQDDAYEIFLCLKMSFEMNEGKSKVTMNK